MREVPVAIKSMKFPWQRSCSDLVDVLRIVSEVIWASCLAHCKKWLAILTMHLSTELQLWRGFKEWCKISPLWLPSIWVMQHMWSKARIEIHPYKDPCHCKNWLVTLPHCGYPNFTLVWLHKSPARQLAQITSLTILGTSTRSLQRVVMEISCSWWQQAPPSQLFSG